MITQRAKAVNPPLSKRYSEEQVFETIDEYYGNKSLIVAKLQCSPQQLEVWLRKPDRKQRLLDAREKILDKSEETVLRILESEDQRLALEAAKFMLTHLGRHRGYNGDSPAMQVNVQSSGNDLKIQVNQLFGIVDEKR